MKKHNAFKMMLFVAAAMLAVACGDDKDDFSVTPDDLVGTEWQFQGSRTYTGSDDQTYTDTFAYTFSFTSATEGTYTYDYKDGEYPEDSGIGTISYTYTYTKPNGTINIEEDNVPFTINGSQMAATWGETLNFTRIK